MDTLTGVYTRRSNRHNWILSGLAEDKRGLIRHVYLASKDYPEEQIGICDLENVGLIADYDNKPSNYPMKQIQSIDLAMAEKMVQFVDCGVVSINPRLFASLVELGLLQKEGEK